MDWTQAQIDVLETASRKAEPCYLRIRALAVYHRSQGKTCQDIAHFLGTTRQSVSKWAKDFQRDGLDGLRIQSGRGRKPTVDHEDVERYLLQSPRHFGISQTRWTLQLLADHVPSLRGFTRAGVKKALKKLGYSYKRGQPHVHSPDPEYELKKKESSIR